MTIIKNIPRKRGDTKDFGFRFTVKREIVPLTNVTALMGVTKEAAPTTANYEFLLTGVVDAAAGEIRFPVTAAQVDRIGTYYYDVQTVDADGKTNTPVEGEIEFTQDRTK